MQWKINNTVICLRMGKTYTTKTPLGDFQITTPEISLLSKQAVTSKKIPIPYTNLQLNPYPNTQLDSFCNDNFLFDVWLPSTWLTNTRIPICNFNHQLKKVIGCKVLQFIPTLKIKKMLGHKTLRYTNTATSSQEWWTRANSVFGYKLLEQTLLNICATCVHFDGP